MRNIVRVVLLAFFTMPAPALTQESVGLADYRCDQFLSDSANQSGSKAVKSLMMISWATGYVAAHQKSDIRGDERAIQLVAEALGDACRKTPTRTAMQAIIDSVNQLGSSNGSSANPNAGSVPAASSTVASQGGIQRF